MPADLRERFEAQRREVNGGGRSIRGEATCDADVPKTARVRALRE